MRRPVLMKPQGEVPYPICVGHEIVGIAVRVGTQAEGGIKVGDRVGVGSQSDSCLGRQGECEECAAGLESYCAKLVITYGSTHYNGGKAMGGHATHHRCPSHFVVKIPDGLASEHAAPMLCGGLTLYAPLKYHACGPGKKVGIVGVGGLGHFGVLFAKALGAERVVGISRSASKGDEVLKMGADEYIATEDDADWAKKNDKSLDLVISTLSSSKVCPLPPSDTRATNRRHRSRSRTTSTCSGQTARSCRWATPTTAGTTCTPSRSSCGASSSRDRQRGRRGRWPRCCSWRWTKGCGLGYSSGR